MMWCQPSGNESSLGMSPVWEWVQSGNESWHWYRMDPHPALVPGDVEAASFFTFSSSPVKHVLICSVLLAHHGQVSAADESLIATTGSWWLVATMKLTYWFTPAGPVWAYIVSLPYSLIPRLLTCSLEMYISLHAVFPSTIRWVVHLSKSIFLPVG